MDNRKTNIVMIGSGHKGIVKLQSVVGSDIVKGTCNLDFRPNNATLYLVGDNIAKVQLNDINTAFEVPFCAKSEYGCIIRSNTATMFGGNLQKSVALKRIDDFNAKISSKKLQNDLNIKNGTSQTLSVCDVKELSEFAKYDGNNFYYAVKPQIDEMFVCYPEEESLQNAIDSSKWVRIDEDDGYYVVGLIFENQVPSFICYGVPSAKGSTPPEAIKNACTWIDVDDKNVDGYWVIFQSAINGKIK